MEDQQQYEDNFTSEDQTFGDYGTDFNEGQQSGQNGDVEDAGGDAAQSSKSSSEEDK